MMVNVMKGGGRAPPPPTPAWDNFTLMMECTPESSVCYSVYSVGDMSCTVHYFAMCMLLVWVTGAGEGVRGGVSQFGRLEKKPGTLSWVCEGDSESGNLLGSLGLPVQCTHHGTV
jgi:hypothetical protein